MFCIELGDFPYQRPRPGQAEFVRFVSSRFGVGDVLVFSAPTGFGKTISILYSLKILLDKDVFDKILYVVRTRNEIDPVIREVSLLGLRFAVLYSARRMCPIVRNSSISVEGFWFICNALSIQGKCPYRSRTNTLPQPIVASAISSCRDHVCIAKSLADNLGICPYFSSISLFDYVQLFVATYPYIFKERIWNAIFSDKDVSRAVLVIDEAHNLLNIGGIAGESISINSVRDAVKEAESLSVDSDTIEFLKKLSSLAVESGARGYKHIDKSIIGLDKTLVDKLEATVFNSMTRLLRGSDTDVEKVEKLVASLSKVANFADVAVQEDYELFLARGLGGDILLSAMPTSYEFLRNIFERFAGIVLMSATPPSNEFLRNVVRVSKNVIRVDVEDFGSRNFLKENTTAVIFTGATTSYRLRGENVYRTYANIVETVYRFSGKGVIMAVYPSYEVMKSILRYVTNVDNMISEGSEPLSEIVENVKSFDKVVLNAVAGGRLSEGIEIVANGESLIKTVIVVGIPYPQPDDYTNAIANEIEKSGGESIDYFREQATIRILQAVGRAVRSDKDYALVILADRRFLGNSITPRLGLRIRFVTKSLEDVAKVVKMFYEQL
ncbi:MAG: ATP-dependent DNA helicase [Ignisphaera sp.]